MLAGPLIDALARRSSSFDAQSMSDGVADCIVEFAEGIVSKVRVPGRCLGLGVSEQLSNH